MSGTPPPLPKLPGFTVSLPQSLGDKPFKKAQTLTYLNGYQREAPNPIVHELPETIKQATAAIPAGTTSLDSPARGTGSPSKLPQWVENDRKVLRFYGYFKESVVESNIENYRIRKVILYYYLEDDSMHIAEPRQDNSGIPQGVFVKRHKLTKDSGGFYSPSDFAVGDQVTIYGRTFFLVDADSFTREFYNVNLGVDLSSPLPYPDDPVDAYRTNFGLTKGKAGATASAAGTLTQRMDDFKSYMEARLGKPSHLLEGDRLRKFLENNRKVLRFWCVWDDRQSMYGDRRPYVLHYFLEDDTVEILEVHDNNSGRDPFPVFLKRGALPKVSVRTGTTITGKLRKDQCYAPEDFRLGMYISVLNRDFLLHDCDRFTKQWYVDNLGYGEDELRQVEVKEAMTSLPKPALPPYNGYGTLEDSLQNCMSLVPKPPKRDMHKLMNKDKIILRFTVRMVETDTHKHSPIDLARRFVMSYFMMDDTVQIFEPPIRNSGIAGGKFLERQKVYKPQSEDIYTYMDLYVGSQIEVHNRSFELMEADEYTYTYMENNKHIFIMADHEILLKSLRAQVAGREDAVRTAFIEMDKNGSGVLSGEELEAALGSAGLKFTRHQAISLKRRMDKDKSGTVSIEEFLGALGIAK
mmetsp:Transcript_40195/g.89186  ORF Transcript_40195/g.89186 Transcript_40195/m.89186 type:complete len:635 (-) Transcript_40195:736-2640(-)|eukprot:CAMPEP_0202900062 /NCGR_PEP_ID=MMETSP1392-20130828/9616_1 /ASSEMBLY_ACC=CAM_ASM_000868 /TAXON_ID=225041 /ORGANISM="Chlamydomonas chlamydogama, Strain SAG 11-48b" /LENGTH=634 /DNA_ID=CAMNT_0049586379 /DNA_START=130 /DNA_END=2034 /DNA_ORIENTATION=+